MTQESPREDTIYSAINAFNQGYTQRHKEPLSEEDVKGLVKAIREHVIYPKTTELDEPIDYNLLREISGSKRSTSTRIYHVARKIRRDSLNLPDSVRGLTPLNRDLLQIHENSEEDHSEYWGIAKKGLEITREYLTRKGLLKR